MPEKTGAPFRRRGQGYSDRIEIKAPTSAPDRRKLLAIYLNDHLAGSSVGVALARRVRDSNREDAVFGPPLAQLCAEIEADRETLERLMERLGATRNPVKPVLGWAGEKLGRLKLNGQLRGYSPLSRLVELEGLALGLTGKERLWRALEHTIDEPAGFDFALMAERAVSQRERVEGLRLRAASLAFPGSLPAQGLG